MTDYDSPCATLDEVPYLGLGPFLRSSIAGQDLRVAARQVLAQLAAAPGNPNVLMNASIVLQCLNQQEMGLAFQREALAAQRTYRIAARQQPARLRLLVLVAPGDIQSNTPLECLLENSDIDLVFYYVFKDDARLASAPAHDILFVGICDSDEHRDLLHVLQDTLANWPQPVLNAPQYLPLTGRDVASTVLRQVPHLLVPPTVRMPRATLAALAAGPTQVADHMEGYDFPLILRPVGSQAGECLEKITSPAEVAHYLASVDALEFFMAPFVDYSDSQGQFRKIRVALIDGAAFVCHMAVSSHWMVHYVNAGMYQDASKREAEAQFMRDFGSFVQKHQSAFEAIAQRMPLEYLVIDCAETQNGDLLLFEIDHIGVVHAMDVDSLFPYKKHHMQKVQNAFCHLLYRLAAPALVNKQQSLE